LLSGYLNEVKMTNSRDEVRRARASDFHSERRRFLLKLIGLGAAGLAVGGGGAWAKTEWDAATTTASSLGDLRLQLDSATAAKAALEISYSALQTQAGEWQSQLIAATDQNAQLASALGTAQQDNSNLQAQLSALQGALDAANGRLGQSSQLVGLYDQLDAVGLDSVVEGGLGLVSGALAALAGPAANLRGGVDSARGLLTSFEAALPDFKDAMAWLGEQVVKLKVGLWAVESTAKTTVNSAVSGVAAVFGGFAGFVLDHLPFNIGEQVRNTLSAVQTVLSGTTSMTDQAADKVLLKISKHVDDGPENWGATLVTPLRDQTLAPADEVLTAVAGADSTYSAGLKDPATAAIAQRRALREQIAAFRAANNL
jgi:hypothetical protein